MIQNDDTISRQAAYDALMAEPLKWDDSSVWESARCHQWMMDMDVIKALPSAPERKRGEWIYKNDLKQFFCSECEFPSLTYDDTYIYGMDLPNYCEDCGADMRTKETDCDYERAVEQLEHDMLYEPTFNQNDGSM